MTQSSSQNWPKLFIYKSEAGFTEIFLIKKLRELHSYKELKIQQNIP